jgi:hypothetical protein
MPRTEARVFTSIWNDPQFLALPGSAQRLYMFLLSQPDLTYCGVMPLRPGRWAKKAADLTVAGIERDLKELEAAERMFVLADAENGELLVRTLLRNDGIWKQPNLLKQARESADQVESPMIRMRLMAELERLPLDETPSEQVKTLVSDFISDLVQGTAYPPDDPRPNHEADSDRDPSGDSTDEDHACARGLGEGYGGNQGDSPNPRTPVPVSPVAAKADRRQGSRMPDPFPVTAEMVAWAREHCPHVDGKRETERFEDHWRGKAGKDGRKLDWVATWRNWMRTAEDRQGPRERHRSADRRQAATDEMFDDALERARAMDAQEAHQ